MFRDADFFASFVNNVLPMLSTFPYIKLWHAGCATGEEVYSMAILLNEHNLFERSIIYGTDINNEALEQARLGIYSVKKIKKAEKNFEKISKEINLDNYFYTSYNHGKISDLLSQNITFSHHNLVQDGVFGEMNVIFCRNVFIYFDRELQNQVFSLFFNSLRYGGFLCLGKGESLHFSVLEDQFEVVDSKQRIYRKKMLGKTG
ncbi:CheR family methyltransferase [Spartinivicinus ruber]|uniref:CheR family methyltransferase n=1 Tax=Spartinivicinus ruber TaxID=2683272 RepID=UPI001CA40F7E|nr:CheR family methyltransferase [Spartinivicinus ruber]